MESLTKIKPLLFCALVSKELSPSDREAFLGVIQSNRSSFLNLCLEVLSDFHFQLAYPKNADLCQSFTSIYAGRDAISRLSAVHPATAGAVCAWAEILFLLRPTEEQLAAFKSAYINWIHGTNAYMVTTAFQGGYYNRELQFLEFVAETYSFDKFFEDELKALLEKKIYIYYGELVALGAYEIEENVVTVHIVYMESQVQSNPTLCKEPKYRGIGRALVAYGIKPSVDAGFNGDVTLDARTPELAKHYERDFGAFLIPGCKSSAAPRYLICGEAAINIFTSYLEEG